MELASYCLPGFEMALRLLENMYTPVTAYRYPSGKELQSVRSFMFDLYLSSNVVEIAQVIGFRVGRLRNRHSIPDITRCFASPSQNVLGPPRSEVAGVSSSLAVVQIPLICFCNPM
jgi:hypothetical protein